MTVCPPKGSNTAHYHDLVKAGNETISEEHRNTLKDSAYHIFMKDSHQLYKAEMLATANMGNMDQILQGFHSLPIPYDTNGLMINAQNVNGTITTPWFQGKYVEEYFRDNRSFLIFLDFPDDIKDQIGGGSLIIELEVDVREEKGWTEDVRMFTFHVNSKSWLEAELECQREGGHLVSVTSDEMNQLVKHMAGDNREVWLGGKREYGLQGGEWVWSDKSTWGYTNWNNGGGQERLGDCISTRTGNEEWRESACTGVEYSFLCQKPTKMKGKKTLNMALTKDHLNFSNFIVWYKYEAASQNLLESWRDKRMTGFRLRWRIEKPTRIWTAEVSEVGRSIKTPGFDGAYDASSGHLYKATLTFPEVLREKMGDGSLLIELRTRRADEVYASTSYKLIKESKSWNEANVHCRKGSGQLASVQSQWEQSLAEQASEGAWVWLGGRKNKELWQWTDNSTWGVTNWKIGHPYSRGKFLMMRGDNKWYNDNEYYSDSYRRIKSLCRSKAITVRENGLTRIELKKEQLTFFPFHFVFKDQNIDQKESNISSTEQMEVPGFALNWLLKDSNGNLLTERFPARSEDWELKIVPPKYEQLLLKVMISLAQELRLQNRTKEEILDEFIHKKLLNIATLEEAGICSTERQIKPERQLEAFSLLYSNEANNRSILPPSAGDIETGYELYHAFVFCPTIPRKLNTFFEHMLSLEMMTSRTWVQTFIHLFQQGTTQDSISKKLVKKFYLVFARMFHFQYGNVLTLLENDWSFLSSANYSDEIMAFSQELGQFLFIGPRSHHSLRMSVTN